MNTFTRWLKFNLVGVMGAAVQLAALSVLNRVWPRHYLASSSLALEVTLLHNFIWHIQYTWRDRSNPLRWQIQCLRFHGSTGIVSLIGNLGLMRVFVHDAHLPVLLANLLTILCCSFANFYIGNQWAFNAARSDRLPHAKMQSFVPFDSLNLTNILPKDPTYRPHYSTVQTKVQT